MPYEDDLLTDITPLPVRTTSPCSVLFKVSACSNPTSGGTFTVKPAAGKTGATKPFNDVRVLFHC